MHTLRDPGVTSSWLGYIVGEAVGDQDGVGLTPVQTVSSGAGCNINAGRERKKS